MSNDAAKVAPASTQVDDDEPDEWCAQLILFSKNRADDDFLGTRGFSARAAQVRINHHLVVAMLKKGTDENMKLTDCYYEKKDWRACKKEVSRCS
jgi:cytochrome c oxidase assembly factor 4